MALVSDKGFEGGVFLLSSTGDDFDLFFSGITVWFTLLRQAQPD